MAEAQDYHAIEAQNHLEADIAEAEVGQTDYSPGNLSRRTSEAYFAHHDEDAQPRMFTTAPEPRSPPGLLKKVKTFVHTSSVPTSRLAKSFKSRFQLHRLLFENFFRWLGAATLLLLTFATFKIFENKGNTTSTQKRVFNSITTVLNILLALNFFASLKELARMLRWRVLAEKPHNVYEVDLILRADSLTSCTKLAFKYFQTAWEEYFGRTNFIGRLWKNKAYRRVSYTFGYLPSPGERGPIPQRKNWRKIRSSLWSFAKVCAWLLTNIAAQGGIAMITLTYSTEAGGPLHPPPIQRTWSSDLSQFYPLDVQAKTMNQPGVSEQFSAHQLGDIGTVFQGENIEEINYRETSGFSQKYYLLSDEDGNPSSFIYRYFNYDAESYFGYAYSVPTERTVSVTWDTCYQFPVVKGAGGDTSSEEVTFRNTTIDENITLVVDLTGTSTTTYIYPNNEYSVCNDGDPRCAKMMAFQKPTKHDAAYVFECQIRVGRVKHTNPEYPEQDLQDKQAHMAAAASGLSGFGSTDDYFTATGKDTKYQFQRYSLDTYWSLAGASSDDAGRMMAEFAMSSLAAMAEFNPKTRQVGPAIVQGVKLVVKWEYVRILLPLIAGAHFIVFILAVFAANPYVVRDESNLANAQVLRPLIEGIGPAGQGSYLTGREIADLVHQDVLKGENVVYGTRKWEEGEKHGMSGKDADTFELFFGPESEMATRHGGDMRHEDGWYL